MEISVTAQLWAILYSVITGVFLGSAYDIVRIGRVLAGLREGSFSSKLEGKHLPLVGEYRRGKGRFGRLFADIFVFAGDILYFLFASAVFCVFVFHANYGYGRWFLVAGCMAGFALYFFTVGRLVMAFSDVIRFVLVSVFLYFRYFLCLPFRMGAKYLFRPAACALSSAISRHRTDKCEKNLIRELRFDPQG